MNPAAPAIRVEKGTFFPVRTNGLSRPLANGQAILGPLSLAETRKYIAREVAAAGITDISHIIEFSAITLIHEISMGAPDAIDTLCCLCIQLAEREGPGPISTKLVMNARRFLQQGMKALESRARSGSERSNSEQISVGRLITRVGGVVVREQALNHGHMLIGRSELSDITVTSQVVSRHHALVVNSAAGAGLVDLGSKNGTFIDGRRIQEYALESGDLISVGDCTITYFTSDT